MGLGEYKRKRNFKLTSEPPGQEPPDRPGAQDQQSADRPRAFVIQKHAASRLHYDFRLELGGVLKSWSVPKGPSLDPTIKRLAVQVEDHPVEYGAFEGIIPKGQYGGGTVLLWDRGLWAPLGNPHQGFHEGNLKFVLQGDKLEGGWALVKLKGHRPGRGQPDLGDRGWLLIKERDPAARPEAELNITDARPESVATRRSLEEIAADGTQVWHSNRQRIDPSLVEGARPAALPDGAHLPVAVATVRRAVPAGDEWLHELAIDGQRIFCRGEGGRMRLHDARGADWTSRAPAIAAAANLLPANSVLIDGVLTALLPDGSSSRAELDAALKGEGPGTLTYFVLDLIFLDGHDLAPVPLERRKELLRELMAAAPPAGPLRFTDHVAGGGPAFLAAACSLGAAAMVSKRRDAPYRPGRARSSPTAVVIACAPPAKRRR